jgi:hypothetical protein
MKSNSTVRSYLCSTNSSNYHQHQPCLASLVKIRPTSLSNLTCRSQLANYLSSIRTMLTRVTNSVQAPATLMTTTSTTTRLSRIDTASRKLATRHSPVETTENLFSSEPNYILYKHQ